MVCIPVLSEHNTRGPKGSEIGPYYDPRVSGLRAAILLSTSYFEDFYGSSLGLTRQEYLVDYRNDWSWAWCQMLAPAGVDCSIYVPTIAEGESATTPDGRAVRFLPLGPVYSPWRHLPTLNRTPVGRYIGQAANAAALLAPLRRSLEADGIDVLIVQEYWTARFDVLVHRLDVPIVAVDQGLPDKRELKLFKRRAFARCSGVVVQTMREAAKVQRFGGESVRVPNAVDTETFSPEESAGEDTVSTPPTILCVARLHEVQKRLSDVIRALAQLPTDWRLKLAGTGPDQRMLEALARELGVADRVHFLGFVGDPTELCRLYREATVVALPSAYEGLPMVLLEAMSCGTPVVGSNIAAIAEVIDDGDSGLLVPVGVVSRLVEALRRVGAERSRFGEAARRAVLASYDRTVVAPRLAELLGQAAGSIHTSGASGGAGSGRVERVS
jgi:glycosyltransferase involved in cell wall biosynthesis